jgi:hypothetical protein
VISHTVIGSINTSVHITYFKSTVGSCGDVFQRNMEFNDPAFSEIPYLINIFSDPGGN